MVRRPERPSARAATVAAAALILAAASRARAESPAVFFPAQLLADGSVVPAHSSVSSDPSDAAAARRRAEILRSPYLQVGERLSLAGGEVEAVFDSSTAPDRRARLAALVEETFRRLFDEARWTRPSSRRSPVTVLLVARRTPGSDGPSVAAWERREKGAFVRPLVLVEAEGRSDDAVRLDLARQLALLSARLSAPSAEPWAVESIAEWAGRRAAGLAAEAAPASDPLVAPTGTIASAEAAASLLRWAEASAGGPGAIREAWEAAGGVGSVGSVGSVAAVGTVGTVAGGGEGFLREVAARAGVGPGEMIAEALSRRSAAAAYAGLPPAAAPSAADSSLRGPAPLAWSWFEVPTPGSASDGVELLVAPSAGARTARVLLAYRGAPGPADVVPVLPGVPTPLATSEGGARLLVVGGGEEGGAEPWELRVSVRTLSGYPAAVEALSARRVEGGVEVSWRTSSHRDLLAWLVVREPAGEGAGTEPVEPLDLVPTTDSSDSGMSFLLVDRCSSAGPVRYRLWALTVGGTLADRGTVLAVDDVP